MPDIKDAKRQLSDALTEAGAMPQWELVATAQILDQPDTMRLRVDNGHLYVHGNAMTFAPAEPGGLADLKSRLNTATAKAMQLESERDEAHERIHWLEKENGRLHGQLEQEQRGREQAEARSEQLRGERDEYLRQLREANERIVELRAERDAARDEMERRGAEWLRESEALGRKNAELHRQVDDWDAEAPKYQQQARDLEAALKSTAREVRDEARRQLAEMTADRDRLRLDAEHTVSAVVNERDEARRKVLELRTFAIGPDTSCTGRATAKVGPASFTMRGCRLTEGHAGPCEARQQCPMATTDKWMRCKLMEGHEGTCELAPTGRHGG